MRAELRMSIAQVRGRPGLSISDFYIKNNIEYYIKMGIRDKKNSKNLKMVSF